MFSGCVSLSTAPTLSARILEQYCYYGMFDGCTNLNSIEVKFINWRFQYATTTNWVRGVAETGTFTCPSDLGTDSNIAKDASHCPEGWTVINK